MNKLNAAIVEIETSGNLSRIDLMLDEKIPISAVVIETADTATYLRINKSVHVLFKETEVMLSTDPKTAISVVNRIPGKITDLKIGDLFCEVRLHSPAGEITAVISKIAWERWPMNLGDDVIALVKINEIMLQE